MQHFLMITFSPIQPAVRVAKLLLYRDLLKRERDGGTIRRPKHAHGFTLKRAAHQRPKTSTIERRQADKGC
jgi:hypothetical protein